MSFSDIALLSAEVEDSFQGYDLLYRSYTCRLVRQPLRTLQSNGSVALRKAGFEMERSLKRSNSLKESSYSENESCNENSTRNDSVKYFVVRGNKPLSLIIKRIHPYARKLRERKSNTRHKAKQKQAISYNSENDKPNVLSDFDNEFYCNNKVSVVFENKNFRPENANFKTENVFGMSVDHSDRLSASENESSMSENVHSEPEDTVKKIIFTNINTQEDCSDRVSFRESGRLETKNQESDSDYDIAKASVSRINIKFDHNDRVSVDRNEFSFKNIDSEPEKNSNKSGTYNTAETLFTDVPSYNESSTVSNSNKNSWDQDRPTADEVSGSKNEEMQCCSEGVDFEPVCSVGKDISTNAATEERILTRIGSSSDENSNSTGSIDSETCTSQNTRDQDAENISHCKDESLQCSFENVCNEIENSAGNTDETFFANNKTDSEENSTISSESNEMCTDQNSWDKGTASISQLENGDSELVNTDVMDVACNTDVTILTSYNENGSILVDDNKMFSHENSGNEVVRDSHISECKSNNRGLQCVENVNFRPDNSASGSDDTIININVAVNTDETFINSNSLNSEEDSIVSSDCNEIFTNQNSWNHKMVNISANVSEYNNELLNCTENSDESECSENSNECISNVDTQETFSSTSCTFVSSQNSEIYVNKNSWDENITNESVDVSECNNELINFSQNSDLSECLENESVVPVSFNVQETLASTSYVPPENKMCTDQNSWDHNIVDTTECTNNVLDCIENSGIPKSSLNDSVNAQETFSSMPFVSSTPMMPFTGNVCSVIPQPAINVCNTIMQPNINPLNIVGVPPVNYIPPVNCVYPAGVGCVYYQPQVNAVPIVNIAQPGNVWNTSFSSSTIVVQSSNNSGMLTGNRLTINSYIGNQTNVCFNSFANVQQQMPVNPLGECSQGVTSMNNYSKTMQFPDFNLQPGIQTVGIEANAFCSSVGMQENTLNLSGNFQNTFMGGGGYGSNFSEDDPATGVIITELSDENDEPVEKSSDNTDQGNEICVMEDQSNSNSNASMEAISEDDDESSHVNETVKIDQENCYSSILQTTMCNDSESKNVNNVSFSEQSDSSFACNYDNTNDIGDASSDKSHFSNVDDLYSYHSDESMPDNEVDIAPGTGLAKSGKNLFLGDADYYNDSGTNICENNLNISREEADNTKVNCDKNEPSMSSVSNARENKNSFENESHVCGNNTVSPINDCDAKGEKEVQGVFLDNRLIESLQKQSLNSTNTELGKSQCQGYKCNSSENSSDPKLCSLRKQQPNQNSVINSTCKSSSEIFIETCISKQGDASASLPVLQSSSTERFLKHTEKDFCSDNHSVKPGNLNIILKIDKSPFTNELLETENLYDKEGGSNKKFLTEQELTPPGSHSKTPFSIFSVRKIGCFNDINKQKNNTVSVCNVSESEEYSKYGLASGFLSDTTNIPSEDSNDTMGFLGFQEDSSMSVKDPWDKFITNDTDNQFKRKCNMENSVSSDTLDRKISDSSSSLFTAHEYSSSDPHSSDVPIYETKLTSISEGIPEFAISEDTVTSVLNEGFSDKEYQEQSPLLFYSDEEASCSFDSKPSSSTEEFGASGNHPNSKEDNLKSFEKLRLRRLRKLLMGVPPPPSVTVPALQISDALKLLKKNDIFNLSTEYETDQGLKNSFTKLPKFTSSETDARTVTWPESISLFFHGISYNLGRESEEFEYLCQKMASRYVGNETMTSCNVISKSPGSVIKRKKRRGFGHSPGSRLSYLARRRHTFSSANLLKDTNAKAGMSKRQIMVEAKKKDHKRTRNVVNPGIDKKCLQTKVNTLKRALFKSPPGRNKPQPKKTSLNFDEDIGANNGSHVGALKEIKNHLQNDELNANGKRVLQHTDYSQPNKCRRNLFQASCGENKLNLQINTNPLNLSPAENNRLVSDKLKTDMPAAADSVSHHRSASAYRTSHSGLNSTHKRKLLWAVAEALREVGISMQHPNFRCYATALTNLCRGHMTDFLKARREFTGQSTSDCMLAVARKYAVKVIDKPKQEAVT